VRLLSATELEQVNDLIRRGDLKRLDGSVVQDAFRDALITINLKRIYPVCEGIPVIQWSEQIETSHIAITFSPELESQSVSPDWGLEPTNNDNSGGASPE
jgi:uncharacterized protein YbaR (Trm112 family)